MDLKMSWREWLEQPPEHRALYLAVAGVRRRMTAVDEREAEKKNEAAQRRGGRG